jgi:hypothetical protein
VRLRPTLGLDVVQRLRLPTCDRSESRDESPDPGTIVAWFRIGALPWRRPRLPKARAVCEAGRPCRIARRTSVKKAMIPSYASLVIALA